MKKALTVLAMILLTANLHAFECKEDGNQQEMNQCAYEDYQKADKELNKVYQELKAKNKDDKKYLENLKKAQLAWIAFRDAEIATIFTCEEEDERICFGSMYPLLYNGEMKRLTEERTSQLKKLIEGLY